VVARAARGVSRTGLAAMWARGLHRRRPPGNGGLLRQPPRAPAGITTEANFSGAIGKPPRVKAPSGGANTGTLKTEGKREMLKLWGIEKPSPVPEVGLGIAGTSNSGKTYLLQALQKRILEMTLSSGLEVGAVSGRDTTVLYKDVEHAEQAMPKGPLPSTIEAAAFRYALFDGAQRVLDFIYHEAIGQLLTHINGAHEHERNREQFVNTLVQANVVWVLLPMQCAPTGEPLGLHARDMHLTKGYLREALSRRPANRPVSIALLLTKADLLGDTPQSALQRMQVVANQVAETFSPLLANSRNVAVAAVFPISALGFGNVQRLDTDAEPQWGLREGAEMEPFNVDKLLLWALVCGVTQQQQPQDAQRYRDVVRRLTTDLGRLPGVVWSLKDAYSA